MFLQRASNKLAKVPRTRNLGAEHGKQRSNGTVQKSQLLALWKIDSLLQLRPVELGGNKLFLQRSHSSPVPTWCPDHDRVHNHSTEEIYHPRRHSGRARDAWDDAQQSAVAPSPPGGTTCIQQIGATNRLSKKAQVSPLLSLQPLLRVIG